MALAALLLYLTGLILAFGMRALVAWLRADDTAFRRRGQRLQSGLTGQMPWRSQRCL